MAYMLLPLGKNIFALKLLLRTMQKLTAMLAVSTSSAMQMIPSADEKYGLDSDSFIGTSLSSGRKTSGRIYYEVPEDAQSIELEYETDFWTDHKEIMKLQ